MWSVDLSNVMMPNADLPGYAAAKRCEIETGESLSTAGTLADRDSQALITGAYSYVQPNPETTVQIKTAVGFVADRQQVTAIAPHVKACFAAETAVDAAITTTADIDTAAWPSNQTGGPSTENAQNGGLRAPLCVQMQTT